MKTKQQIEKFLQEFDAQESKFPGMTYEQGVEGALMWVLCELEDEEFSPLVK